ncbi:methyl-accepting chemotaxis protein, partial [Campylobacter jejuni]
SDMNAIHKIFEEYKSLDFRNKLENASGSVELTTNALGDESGKLQTAVQSLTTSSNSQAQSLEETAAALEEITSS